MYNIFPVLALTKNAFGYAVVIFAMVASLGATMAFFYILYRNLKRAEAEERAERENRE